VQTPGKTMPSRIALINPSYYSDIFLKSKARAAVSRGTTSLGLAALAAPLLQDGHCVRIWDLNLQDRPTDYLAAALREFNPDFVGITSTTPLIKKAYETAAAVKKFSRQIYVIAGGPHPSALPEDVLRESEIDCVVRGEGDLVLKSIVAGDEKAHIPNIYYKQDGAVLKSKAKESQIDNLDALPFPAYSLFDIDKYSQPSIVSRRRPLGYMETSRGCFARCVFCNKNIHGYRVRMKSPARVADEMQAMLRLGFREIQLIDDIFTADFRRVAAICDEILKRGLDFPWYPRGGIRVDRADPAMLKLMKKAGCYRIPFGIESGSQRVQDAIGKGTTLDQARRAVKCAKEAGFETECYFMIGLPTETEEDVKKSIEFALELDPDYVKFAIAIPLPGTPMFDTMLAEKRLKTTDWEKYNFSASPKELYDHDRMSWETIDRYYALSHKKFYLRPRYAVKMLYKTLKEGTFWGHVKAFTGTQW